MLGHLSHLLRAKVSPKNQSQASHSGEGEPVRPKGTFVNFLKKSHLGSREEVEYLWLVFCMTCPSEFVFPTSLACWTWRVEKNNSQGSRSQNGWGGFQDKTRIPNSYDRCMVPFLISIQHIRKYLVMYSNSSHQGFQNCDKRCWLLSRCISLLPSLVLPHQESLYRIYSDNIDIIMRVNR